jgi:hypothetical protein
VVATTTVDALAQHLKRPSVLKIDVEGAEAIVLKGARGVLSADRPLILCEVGTGSRQEVAALLNENEYVMFDADAAGSRSPILLPTFNVIACPRERVSSFPSLSP